MPDTAPVRTPGRCSPSGAACTSSCLFMPACLENEAEGGSEVMSDAMSDEARRSNAKKLYHAFAPRSSLGLSALACATFLLVATNLPFMGVLGPRHLIG